MLIEMAERRLLGSGTRRLTAPALWIGFLLALAPSGYLAAAPQEPPASLDRALETLESGDGLTAEREFRRLLLDDPDSLEALLGWARSLAAQDRGVESVRSLLSAAERRLSAGAYGEAIELLELAALLDPDSPRTQARLGRALILDRRYLAAEEPLRQALAQGGRSTEWLLQLGGVLWEKGALEEAEELHREAAEGARASSQTWRQLGRFLLWRGRYAEAAEALARARSLGAAGFSFELDRARALEGWARALETTGEGQADEVLRQALAAFEGAVDQAPEHSEARYGLARVLTRLGRSDQADTQLAIYHRLYVEDQSRTRDKGLAKASLDRARDLLRQRRAGEAASILATLPETVEVLAALALAQREEGRREAAMRTLERALLLAPDRADLRALLVEVSLESEGRE